MLGGYLKLYSNENREVYSRQSAEVITAGQLHMQDATEIRQVQVNSRGNRGGAVAARARQASVILTAWRLQNASEENRQSYS